MRLGWVLAAALVGCTDYGLRTDRDDDTTGDEEDWADTGYWGKDCPDRVTEGYEARGTSGCQPESGPLPDLTLELAGRCEVDCDEDRVSLYVHPGNRGAADQGGARIEVWALEDGERELADTVPLAGVIPTGGYQDSVRVEVVGLEWDDLGALALRVAHDGEDCEPANDELNVIGPFCE